MSTRQTQRARESINSVRRGRAERAACELGGLAAGRVDEPGRPSGQEIKLQECGGAIWRVVAGVGGRINLHVIHYLDTTSISG